MVATSITDPAMGLAADGLIHQQSVLNSGTDLYSTMTHILIIGVNHKTAPVEIRECIAFSEPEVSQGLETLIHQPSIKEAMLVSTCNRVELVIGTNHRDRAIEAAKIWLAESKHIPVPEFESYLYLYEGDEAVRHLFRVASSLDSMMVGEPQILGQIKGAYRTAVQKKTSGVILNRLLHKTFFVAKRVRTETGIGDHAVSISYAAVELGKKIFGSLEKKQVLLIGAGEMAELALEHLIRNRVGTIYVANRTFERGVELARRFRGQAIRFEEISSTLEIVDIIISSTGAPDYVIRKRQIKPIMRPRKNRPLFFIDIAVPRDIDPEINRLSNVYVYDIDDLKSVVDENIEDRKREAMKAERIIEEAVIRFRQWYESLSVVPTIVALRKKLDTIAERELKKTLGSLRHLSETDHQAIRKMTEAMVKKIMHDPTHFLKLDGCGGNQQVYLDVIRKLFRLDEEEVDPEMKKGHPEPYNNLSTIKHIRTEAIE